MRDIAVERPAGREHAPPRPAIFPLQDVAPRAGDRIARSMAVALPYLSPNTIKSYIRTLYRKIDVTSRTQAVLWGVDNGFLPDHHRIEHWRGGP